MKLGYAWVDYNDIDDGVVYTYLSECPKATVGMRIATGDNEGRRCMGVVVAVDSHWIWIKLELDTFREEGR